MTTSERALSDIYWDPYDVDLYAHPYDAYRRLRNEAPLYYNERHDFYALSRFDDVKEALADRDNLLSGRGNSMDQIKMEFNFPPATLVYEDEPVHRPRRALLAGVFTPRKMRDLDPQIRAYCEQILDPFVGAGTFDLVPEVSDKIPMRVIGMLLGIPEKDCDDIKAQLDAFLEQVPGEQWEVPENMFDGEVFADYVEWRAKNPSDDLMTELLQAEFTDENGVVRRLARSEVLSYVNMLAAAGNDTTGLLITWLGKLLADHPEQRRLLVEDRSLINNAIEETLRIEPSSQATARYVVNDVEYHGRVVPAGSVMMLLGGSANHDERVYDDPDVYDIRREATRHLTFGHGIHACIGSALARAEGQIFLDEFLKRFPDYHIEGSSLRTTANIGIRGWASLPVVTP